jgi:hypothetical protein
MMLQEQHLDASQSNHEPIAGCEHPHRSQQKRVWEEGARFEAGSSRDCSPDSGCSDTRCASSNVRSMDASGAGRLIEPASPRSVAGSAVTHQGFAEGLLAR